MNVEYLAVAEDENEEPIELPLEQDGTMLLSTLEGVYPGACGMKFRNPDTNSVRGVRLSEGILHPPSEGWNPNYVYLCCFQLKRKIDDSEDSDRSTKSKRMEKKIACTDLICLGLPWKATEDSVREYFGKFGEVVMVQLKKDPSGKFKGFGFIRFGSYASQMRAISQRHKIDGRWVDVRIPNSKEGMVPQMPCKVFVGRCTEDITAEDLREYFSEFGEVIDVFVPRPFRAFGFVTFSDHEVAQSLCGEDHVIKGASVSVTNAAPKSNGKFGRYGPGRDSREDNWNRNNNYNSNYDNCNLQTLGINPNLPQNANVNVPISFVAAALNAGLINPNGGDSGGNWNSGPNKNNGGWGGSGGKNWNQGQGGSWNQGYQGNWNQPGHQSQHWNKS